jgi:DNA mismatch repair protein MutL
MPIIKHLPSHEAQKIAAGQVIERPADIIKELIENSIDADATSITLYVEDAGKQLIRVVDNGCGMDAQDAQTCFEKHATSKIQSMDELQHITTFGFRGEAMPSIAAVCKVNLITKQQNASEGLQLQLHDSIIQTIEPISASTGTDICASDLFYTIPVRKKFLKKNDTELRHITQLFHAFCFSYPAIHFKLFSDNKQLLNCPPVKSITDRCTQLWQNISTHHMLNVSTQTKDVTIHGAISDHQNFKFDRTNIFLFVNNRWIKDFKLSNAFIKGYMNVAPQGRYPMGCLSITVDPKLVDINVHPRKEEVRFLHPRVVEQLIQATVKACLEENIAKRIPAAAKNNFTTARAPEHMYASLPSKNYASSVYTPFNFDAVFPPPESWNAFDTKPTVDSSPITQSVSSFKNIHENNQPTLLSKDLQIDIANHSSETGYTDHYQTTPESAEKITQAAIAHPECNETLVENGAYTIIGQYNKTYILLEEEDGLFIIDQHAAHERVLYELFAHRFTDVALVPLLFPILITLTAHDIHTIEPYLSIFIENGISIELFSSTQLKIQATPVHLKEASFQDFIQEAIGWIHEYTYLDAQQLVKKLHEKLRAQMACKAAVKAGDILSHAHMQQLLESLQKSENRLTCPHGRPTGWLLSNHEIEKKFKRKL